VQDAVAFGYLDVRGGGVGVLGGVGECFGDGVVGGWLGQPPVDLDVEIDGNGGSAGQRLESWAQPCGLTTPKAAWSNLRITQGSEFRSRPETVAVLDRLDERARKYSKEIRGAVVGSEQSCS
jgi:hypothetical protein